MLTYKEADRIFKYDEKKGIILWNIKHGKMSVGDRAGSCSGGYISIIYKGLTYKAHLIVILLNTGGYPSTYIEHIDGNLLNNKFENLREKGAVFKQALTVEELKRQLHYNPGTGIFTRKINKSGNRGKAGSVAGYNSYGYIGIHLNGRAYKAHRLAVLYMEGFFPEESVDHINRIKNDNRWNNLRYDISFTCQARNRTLRSDNSTGITGVYYLKREKKYTTKICINGKTSYIISRCSSLEEAVCHRLAAEQCVDWSDCLDQSTAYTYVKNNIQKKGAQNDT